MLKKLLNRLKPFEVECDGCTHRTWSYREALSWAGCYGAAFGTVNIVRNGRVIGRRF